jgi:hypothetical protein
MPKISAKISERCVPLEFLQKAARQFPGVWDAFEDIRKELTASNTPRDGSRRYIPMERVLRYLEDFYNANDGERLKAVRDMEKFKRDIMFECLGLTALAQWRRDKNIYAFQPELAEMLLSQEVNENEDIPSEVLLRLPRRCIYITAPGLDSYIGADGFFAHYDVDPGKNELELRLLYVSGEPELISAWPVTLVRRALKENFQYIAPPEQEAERRAALCRTLNLVYYICSVNSEISPAAERRTAARASPDIVIKDKYREIRRWDVGIRISSAIRRANEEERKNETGERGGESGGHPRNTMRPHTRRAHWHHYWTGKRDSDLRTRVLKWLPPAYVGARLDDDEMPVVIRGVETNKSRH